MAELGLFPDPKVLVIQGIIFIGALASANHFIIKPALRLHSERRKRTSGAVHNARNLEMRAEALETAYESELKARNEEAKNLHLSEVLAGQAEAESILAQAQKSAREHVESIQVQLDATVKNERARLPALVDSVADSILKQLGAATAATVALLAAGAASVAEAAAGAPVDVWYSIFWPYFQFLCFISVLAYFGRKTIHGILESRRDALRTKLSEANQALTLAERKAQEYEARMANLHAEVSKLMASRVEEGIRERNKIVADAQAVAATLVRDAERAANELVAKAREDLRKDLVSLAIDAVDARLSGEKAKAFDNRLKQEALQGVASLKGH